MFEMYDVAKTPKGMPQIPLRHSLNTYSTHSDNKLATLFLQPWCNRYPPLYIPHRRWGIKSMRLNKTLPLISFKYKNGISAFARTLLLTGTNLYSCKPGIPDNSSFVGLAKR